MVGVVVVVVVDTTEYGVQPTGFLTQLCFAECEWWGGCK